MAKDYSSFVQELITDLGGKENITNVFHCATRLRFSLKDNSIADNNLEKIKNTTGVIDVIVQNGQFQVVIGPHVSKVFTVVSKELGLDENKQEDSSDESSKSIGDKFFEAVSGIFTPIVPVLMASGMMAAVLTILKLIGVMDEHGSTYFIFNLVYEAGFYFLPFFIAYTSARVFKTNPLLAMLLAGIMLIPRFVNYQDFGIEHLTFFGIDVPALDYNKAVLPVILGVWLLSYVVKFFEKVIPDIVRLMLVPLLAMIVVLPIQLIIIGPLGNHVANLLADGVAWMGDTLGFAAVMILAFLTPLMLVTGTHSFAFPVIVATLTTVGYDQLLMPAMLAENLAMAGAVFGLALQETNKERKSAAYSASFTAVLGISEPAMYGFALPAKHAFVGAMFGAGIGGLFAGIFKFKMYIIASASVIGIPAMFPLDGGGTFNVIIGLSTIAISFVAGLFITLALSKSNFKFGKSK